MSAVARSIEQSRLRLSPRGIGPWIWCSLATVFGLAALATVGWFVLDRSVSDEVLKSEVAKSLSAFELATGVQFVRISLTGGGGLLDVRFRVVNPDKAIVVHDPDTPPTIIHEVTGERLDWPWHQHTSSKEMRTAVTYYDIILNLNRHIKRGDLVTLEIGEAKLEHIVVQ